MENDEVVDPDISNTVTPPPPLLAIRTSENCNGDNEYMKKGSSNQTYKH
jgi:hypothetical protein